jgi:MoaA/NifB/PqqE/SkfB family radical SAM enzyme
MLSLNLMENDYQYSLEIVGSCNLRCPSCPVGNMNNRNVSKNMITKELFIKIIDKISLETPVKFPLISLFDWGEPTLHPELPFFIEYIKQKGARSKVSSNLNIDADFENIIKANPQEFKISLSGYLQENYSKTHARGNIDKVFSNMHKIKFFIDKYNSSTKVTIGYHLYKHNLGIDFTKMQDLAKTLNFIFEPDVAHFMPIEKALSLISENNSEIKNRIAIDLPKITEEDNKIIKFLLTDPKKEYLKWVKSSNKNRICRRQSFKTAIRVDGSVPICCGVYGDEHLVTNSFLENSHQEIQKKRVDYKLCDICIDTGTHVNWKNSKNSFLNKQLVKNNIFGKITRFFISKKYLAEKNLV